MNEFLKIPGGGRVRKDLVLTIVSEASSRVAEFTFPPRIIITWIGGGTCLKFVTGPDRDAALNLLEAQMELKKEKPKKRKPKIIYE